MQVDGMSVIARQSVAAFQGAVRRPLGKVLRQEARPSPAPTRRHSDGLGVSHHPALRAADGYNFDLRKVRARGAEETLDVARVYPELMLVAGATFKLFEGQEY